MRKKVYQTLSFFLALVLMVSMAFPRRAWASGNMKVTTVESSTIERDEESQETATKETVVDGEGNLISDHGEAQGKETTTIKGEEDTKEETEEEVVLENNQAITEDGKKIQSEEPEVTIELQPGQEAEKAEDMAAWFDEDSLPDGKVTEEKITYARDEKGRLAGYTEVEIRDGKIVHYSDPLMGKLVSK